MTQIDTDAPAQRPSARRSRSARTAPGAGRLRSHLRVLEAERELHAKARFDTGGDIGDRAWRVEGETQLVHLDAQIRRLRDSLEELAAIPAALAGDQVAVGVAVTLCFLADQSVEQYVVGAWDVQDDECAVLTPDSPLGRVLLGARVGDTVEYAAPRGTARVFVEAIGNRGG